MNHTTRPVGSPSSVTTAPAPAIAMTPSGPVTHQGRWLTDSGGRVLLMHGVNMVAKEPPYEPNMVGFSDEDATWLADNGFRVVRLGVLATGLMSTPGVVDNAYITQIAATVDMLSLHGIYTLLDFHQDGWGPAEGPGVPLGDDGFPAWMTRTNFAYNSQTSFPLYYITNPAIQAAFQSLWDNAAASDGTALRADYAQMFAALGARFAGNADVLGYDLFNEPWPGTTWQPCTATQNGCPELDASELDPTYASAVAGIRAAGDQHLIFGEPFTLFNFGVSTTHIAVPGGDAQAGMAFHMYTTDPAKEPNVLANAADWSASTGGALINTEWGATTDAAAVSRQGGEMDAALMPWIFWSYCCEVVRSLNSPPAGANLVDSTVGALVRPYPLAVSGTPTFSSYDTAIRALNFTWSTNRVGGGSFAAGAVTTFSVPASVYPDGYGVSVTGGSVVSGCGTSEVSVSAAPNVSSVTVRIVRGASVPVTCVPLASVGGIADRPNLVPEPSGSAATRARDAAPRSAGRTTAYALAGAVLAVVVAAGASGWYLRRKRPA